MRILNNKNKTVFVMTGGGGGGGCPRAVLAKTSTIAKIKDDYYGRVRVSRTLMKKFSSIGLCLD